MKLLAFAASNSSQSINRQLVDYVIGLLQGGEIEGVDPDALEISTLDLNDFEMPIYSIDRQEAGASRSRRTTSTTRSGRLMRC